MGIGASKQPDCSHILLHLEICAINQPDCIHVLLWFAFRDLCKEWATPIFSTFHRTASSTTGAWCRNILMCFYLYIYISFSARRSLFWTLRMSYYFYKVCFCVYFVQPYMGIGAVKQSDCSYIQPSFGISAVKRPD